MKKLGFLYLLLCTVILIQPLHVIAQGTETPTLEDLIDPQPKELDTTNMTSTTRANDFFKQCVKEDKIAYNDEEQEMLCGCVSANLVELLSVSDFDYLDKKSAKAKDIRSKYMAYAYAPCMSYPMENKVRNSCYANPKLKDIIFGKDKICDCSVQEFNKFLAKLSAPIIKQGQKHNPTTLDPLSHYIVNLGYDNRRDKIIEKCRFEMLYNQKN